MLTYKQWKGFIMEPATKAELTSYQQGVTDILKKSMIGSAFAVAAVTAGLLTVYYHDKEVIIERLHETELRTTALESYNDSSVLAMRNLVEMVTKQGETIAQIEINQAVLLSRVGGNGVQDGTATIR